VVNGGAGVVVAPAGRATAIIGFTIAGDRIVEIDLVADPEKLRRALASRQENFVTGRGWRTPST
jgi:hypothetical protein